MRMSRREDWITVGLSLWLLIGLFVDGWAHNTQPALETFFTPWHALFYSGFTATAGWLLWSVFRRMAPGRPWRQAVPAGYGPALAGVLLFGISGLGDLIWHQVFGIEQDIAALLSPTHLGLITGAFLILTAPARAQASDPALGASTDGRRHLPAVLSVSLAGALIGFILQSWHPLVESPAAALGSNGEASPFGPNAPWFTEQLIVSGVPQYLMATVFLFGPMLWLARTWQLPAAAGVIGLGLQAVLMQAMVGIESPGLMALGVLGGLAVSGLTVMLRPGPGSLARIRLFAGLAPLLFWTVHFAGIGLAGPGLGWQPELWGGCLIWSALVGLGMTLLLPSAPVGRPVGAPDGEPDGARTSPGPADQASGSPARPDPEPARS